jgi:hypothetical protein
MRVKKWTGLLLVGALGAAGCGDDNDNENAEAGGGTTPAASTPAPTTVATVPETVAEPDSQPGEALFTDSFDDDRNGWGVIDDPQYGSAGFAAGDYVWEFTGSVAHQLPAVLGEQYDRGELDMRDVVVRADATILAGDGVIGVFCRETPDTDAEWQWYEFVARDGFAAIRHADDEGNLDVLAETDDVSLPAGEPFAIEAACVDDPKGETQLSLTLNGTEVLQATDDEPLGNGAPGLQAWTFPMHERMDIRWHEFTVHQPEP